MKKVAYLFTLKKLSLAFLPLTLLSLVPPMLFLLSLDVHPPSGRQLPGSCAADEGGS